MNFYQIIQVFICFTVSGFVTPAIVSRGKSVTSSSQFSNWGASRILDGVVGTLADSCECCSATLDENNPWYELDLGKFYTVNRIHVQGRQDQFHGQHFDGMIILLKSVHDGFSTGSETTVSGQVFNYDYQLPTAKSTRYVSLVLNNIQRVFTICELTVYGDCQDGEFGTYCGQRCYCSGEFCNKETGICPSGECQPGYSGPSCDVECVSGRFGSGCNETCGFCEQFASCDKEGGNCPGNCTPGYQGDQCKRECDDGTYGSGCAEQCGFCFESAVCDKTNGNCPDKCEPGYFGDRCQKECPNGKYGMNCNETCGNCQDDVYCLHTNGTCPDGCYAGYEGLTCKTECMDGYYGSGCTMTCGNCFEMVACNKTSGLCETGCGPGFIQPYCKDACSNGLYGDGCSSPCGNCKRGSFCNHIDGTCGEGCVAGYMPGLCNEECEDGNHGEDCMETCGQCLNNDPCNKVNGTCQGCEADYAGHDCKTYLKKEGGSSALGGAIGGAVGGVVAAVVVTITVIVFVKRRKLKKYTKDSTDNFSAINQAFVTNTTNEHKASDSTDYENTPDETKPSDADDDTYYEFLVRKTDLKICQLWDYIYQKKKYDNVLFYQEFNRLLSGLLMPRDVAMLPENRIKNRYRALCAYDHNRVPLNAEEAGESEYINASYINGIGLPRKFIASQGPTKDMRIDFLRMVWQQRVKQIVMLTNLIEASGEKCLIYWPEKGTETFGNIILKLDSEDWTTDYVIRKLMIRQKEEPWRTLTQYHFKAWPDKDVPEGTWPLIKLWRMVMTDAKENSVPILVHCSAGIGRTGTFIALDNAYNQAKTEGTLRMLDVVTSLRKQRVNMVQTRDQYVFLHEAVADALLFGTHYIWSRDYPEVYTYLTQVDLETRTQRLQQQYDLIVESVEERKRIQNEVNTSSDPVYGNIYIHNQSTDTSVTIDEYRPKSKKFDNFQELDAILLPAHDEKEAFIISKCPSSTTRESYLSLIIEQNVKTVVILQGTMSSKDKKLVDLAEIAELGTKYGLELIEEKSRDSYRQREVRYMNNGEPSSVCQFEFLSWKNKQFVPDDPRCMLDFLERVLLWQQRLSANHPVLVHGSNGFERSGMVCVLLNELERMRRDEGHINIVETVKLMKERNETIIINAEQYKFVHEAIFRKVCKKDDDDYASPDIKGVFN